MSEVTTAHPALTSHKHRAASQTLLDHLQELRVRLFFIVLTVVLAAGVGYALQDQIIHFLMLPLGDQKLVYLTPIGGFNFLFKISLYVGILVAIPMIVYQLYRFLQPLMTHHRRRAIIGFSFCSTLLAAAGICFAYFASLPAALHFLTSFQIQNVSAMLTVDSYLAFVITYLLGFAALFQIPLILLIVNGVRPLPPGALMKSQRFVVLGAFVIAAIISPTPDVTNQAILAIPVIIMYQFGVIMVWLQARSARRTARLRAKKVSSVAAMPARPLQQTTSVNLNKRPAPTITPIPPVATALTTRPPRRPLPVMDIGPARQRQPRPTPVLSSRPASPLLQRPAQVIRHTRPNPVPPVPRYRSVDGVISL